MYKRLLGGLGLWAIALGCASPSNGVPNTEVLLSSAEPVPELDALGVSLDEIASQMQFATWTLTTFAVDADSDGEVDDARTLFSLLLKSEPGCFSPARFMAAFDFKKESLNTSVEEAATFTAGEIFQGGGGEFGDPYTLSLEGDEGRVFFMVNNKSGRRTLTWFQDLNDTLIEIDALDEERASVQLSSTLLRQVLPRTDEAVPTNIALLATVTDAERCFFPDDVDVE